jgi:hypothetical protein
MKKPGKDRQLEVEALVRRIDWAFKNLSGGASGTLVVHYDRETKDASKARTGRVRRPG